MNSITTYLLLTITLLMPVTCLPLPTTGQDLYSKENITFFDSTKKGSVLVFLSSICPCSNSHIEELINLSKEFTDFKFIGIHSNSDENIDEVKKYFKDKKVPFIIVKDNDQLLANGYKALRTPHVFILNSSNEILYNGAVSDSSNFSSSKKNYLRQVLGEIILNKKISIKDTRPLGCEITR